MWGNSDKYEYEWNKMIEGNYIIITSTKDSKVTILQITQKFNSEDLSQNVWNDSSFPFIYILNKVNTLDVDILTFYKEYFGYKGYIQGNMIAKNCNVAKLISIIA